MAFLSSTSTYAIRALLHVAAARPDDGEFVSTRTIAEELGVPFTFLTKVLLGLTQNGILVSQRGATGGVALARPAETITLFDVLESIGEESVFHDCILGLPKCSNDKPCALHHSWSSERADMQAMFEHTSL